MLGLLDTHTLTRKRFLALTNLVALCYASWLCSCTRATAANSQLEPRGDLHGNFHTVAITEHSSLKQQRFHFRSSESNPVRRYPTNTTQLGTSTTLTCDTCDPGHQELKLDQHVIRLTNVAVFVFKQDTNFTLQQMLPISSSCTPRRLTESVTPPHFYVICRSDLSPRYHQITWDGNKFTIYSAFAKPENGFTGSHNWTDGVILHAKEVGPHEVDDDLFVYVKDGHIFIDYIYSGYGNLGYALPTGTICLNATNVIPMGPDGIHPRMILECTDGSESTTLAHRYIIKEFSNPSSAPRPQLIPSEHGIDISDDSQFIAVFGQTTIQIFPTDTLSVVIETFDNLGNISSIRFFRTASDIFLEVLIPNRNITLISVTEAQQGGDEQGKHELPNSVPVCDSKGCLPHQMLFEGSEVYLSFRQVEFYRALFFDTRNLSCNPRSIITSSNRPEMVNFEHLPQPTPSPHTITSTTLVPPGFTTVSPFPVSSLSGTSSISESASTLLPNSTPSEHTLPVAPALTPSPHSETQPHSTSILEPSTSPLSSQPIPNTGSSNQNLFYIAIPVSIIVVVLGILAVVFAYKNKNIHCCRVERMQVTTTGIPESAIAQQVRGGRESPVGETSSTSGATGVDSGTPPSGSVTPSRSTHLLESDQSTISRSVSTSTQSALVV